MKILIDHKQYVNLTENYQVAEKNFIKTGKLTRDELDYIESKIYNKQYTNLYATIFSQYKDFTLLTDSERTQLFNQSLQQLNDYYKDNRKPKIKELIKTPPNFDYTFQLTENLELRKRILNMLEKLPSNYYRNIIKLIPNELSLFSIRQYYEILSNIVVMYNTYKDYENIASQKTLDVAFSSKFESLKEIQHFLHDNYDSIHNVEQNSVGDVKSFIQENGLDGEVDILYEKGKKLIVVVFSHNALKKLTCNTKLCFSRTGSQRQWETYAGGSHVILFYDFNYSDYASIMTIILPDDLVYSADNMPVEDEFEEPVSGRKLLRKYLPKSVIDNYIY